MNYISCITSVAHMRKEPSHKSEIVSQLLFGEFGLVLETTKDFTLIKCLYDEYEGWCQKSQITRVDIETIQQPVQLYHKLPIDTLLKNGSQCRVSIGTPVLAINQSFCFGNSIVNYTTTSKWNASEAAFTPNTLTEVATCYLNTPYLWGGKSTFGIDCSGFTQQVFKMFDIRLPRDAYQQAMLGESVSFIQEAQCGDLAFFDNEEGKITHVGLLLNNMEIIHSSGCVRIDKIDNQGIINVDTGERTHRLRIIKRFKK